MVRPRFKSCFISAPFGADTSILRAALEQRRVRWRDQTSVTPNSSWLDVLDDEVSASDFVCVVLPAEHQGNILFELGVAYAKRKPILAFINSTFQLPTDIPFLTYVRSDPTKAEAVGRALDAFLEHARVGPVGGARRIPSKGRARGKRTVPKGPSIRPVEFEQRTADLLQQAGSILSGPREGDQGVDFAVWIDELEHSLGNPLLVEVKSGDISTERLREAASQLRHYVEKTHGRCGLLVYWDRANREFPPPSGGWPVIFQLSGASLGTLISQRRLVQELVRLRNAAVHGKV
jgi:hypothetical protein